MADGDDHSFGPQYGNNFDLTLRFEHIILTILPAIILIVTFPNLLYHYTRKMVVVGRGWPLYAKLVSALCLLGLELGNLVLWAQQHSPYYSSLAIVASSLSFAAVCCVIGFIDVEHRHSIRSSSLFSIYMTLSLLFDLTKARTCFSRDDDLRDIGSLLIAAATLKGGIIVLEEMPKGAQILDEQQRRYGSESTSGFWSRSLFLWLNRTLLFGYNNALEIEDLERLDDKFSAAHLSDMFSSVWTQAKEMPTSHCLMKALVRCLYRPLCAIIVPRLCHTAFLYSQPLLLRRAVLFVDRQETSEHYARGLIGATVLIYLGIAISRAVYTHLNYRLVTLARGVLVSQILEKSLKIEYYEASEKSALSLMNTDIEALVTGLPDLHENWVSFVEVGVGIYLLASVVGQASYLVFLPVILSTVVSMTIGKQMGPARKAWNDKIQHRVSQTASAFKHIKGIKMLAISSPVSEYLQKLRVSEIEQSKPFRLLALCIPTAATFGYTLTPVFVIGGAIFWANSSDRLTAVDTFPILAIIAIISQPLIKILSSYPNLSSALACMRRIQDFLLLDEREDRRIELEPSEYVFEEVGATPSVASPTTQATPPPDHGDIVFSGQLVSIKSWNGRFLIRNASFRIQRSTLTVLTGPVASGKSVFLLALLGEVRFEGIIQISSKNIAIAYCGQVPWIRNMSIRENIIGEQVFDPAWYEAVLDACLLVEDLLQLPDRDETMTGSDGSGLSGGQRQRIALARAIYSRAEIMVLDDVLSGLDTPTFSVVAVRLFGGNGLLRYLQTTVIVASHSGLLAKLADNVFFLDGAGNIQTRAVPVGLPSADDTIFASWQYSGMEPSRFNGKDKMKKEEEVPVEDKVIALPS